MTRVTPGASIHVAVNLPPGPTPTAAYKIVHGAYVDVSQIAQFSGHTVTLTIADGGLGDEDGRVNGVIVDPLTPLRGVKGTKTLTLSTSSKITKRASSKFITIRVTLHGVPSSFRGAFQLVSDSKVAWTVKPAALTFSTSIDVSSSTAHTIFLRYLGSSTYRPTCSWPLTVGAH